MLNVTNIPAPRVNLTDGTGNISREWYRFFQNLFLLTGAGQRNASLQNPTVVSVGASPFIYSNESGGALELIVSGGGITKMEISRDQTTFIDTGSYYGMFALAPKDVIRITYMAVPTVTAVTQ
jgi:hypothetical protein